MKNLLVALIISFLAINILAYSLISSEKEETIQVGYNVESLNYAPLVIAYEKGFLHNKNLDVKLIPLKGGNEVKQVLASGNIDIGLGGAANFFTPIEKGAPIVIVAPLSLSPTYLFVNKNTNIKSFKDLKDKKIAANPGGSSYTYFLYALKKEGIDYKSINFMDLDKTPTLLALTQKAIDAALISEQEEEKYREAGAVLHEEWEKKGYSQSKFPRTIIAMNKDFLSKIEDADKFIDAIIEAHAFINSNPKESSIVISDHIKKATNGAVIYSPKEIENIWEEKKLTYILWYDPNMLLEIAQIEKETGQLEKTLTLSQIFNPIFKEKLKKAQYSIYGPEN